MQTKNQGTTLTQQQNQQQRHPQQQRQRTSPYQIQRDSQQQKHCLSPYETRRDSQQQKQRQSPFQVLQSFPEKQLKYNTVRKEIELLSLPRRTGNVTKPLSKTSSGFTGLPINSLPGWEFIPLNCKLPMLKCPGNDVIFSKNKIGHTFNIRKLDFDLSTNEAMTEYNPLHDPNLRKFYTSKHNLKRLRQNNEITENNDVICTLKDFNRFRIELHKSQVYYMLQALHQHDLDLRDKRLDDHCERILECQEQEWEKRSRKEAMAQVILRKQRLEAKKAEYFRRVWEHTLNQFEQAEAVKEMNRRALQQQRAVTDMQILKHQEARDDIQRSFLIRLKKNLQTKSDRFEKSLRRLNASRNKEDKSKDIESWEKRLLLRLKHQQRVHDIMVEAEGRRAKFIEIYGRKCEAKWKRIQREIRKRSRLVKRARRRYFRIGKPSKKAKQEQRHRSTVAEYRETFEMLLDSELCDALNTAIQLTENPQDIPFSPDDPIYKAATFIVHDIIAKYNKDLSHDCDVVRKVVKRMVQYFEEVSKIVQFRATQIISAARLVHRASKFDMGSHRSIGTFDAPELARLVSFNELSSTIGMSSYSIHPLIDLKNVGDRQPTPPGSLASIVIDSREDIRQDNLPLTRYDSMFVEHYIIRFKRELVVGMGRRVFAAIRCHYQGKIMSVRKEFLTANRKVLAKMAAKAILSFAKNPLPFKSCVLLCTSVLANQLIWSLQKELIKPNRDPRGIVQSTQGCTCVDDKIGLCLYCQGCM